MSAKIFFSCLALLICFPYSGFAKDAETVSSGNGQITELWQGKVLTATFRAGMCFDSQGKARGVLLLKHANGQEDAYHLYGTVKNNKFDLSHSSGHFFSGELAPQTMRGKVKINKGPTLSLEGKRIKDAPLMASDCAPLPSQSPARN